MSHLFEFGDWRPIEDAGELKVFLSQIYDQQRWRLPSTEQLEDETAVRQPYIQIDGNLIRAANYSGFIQHGKQLLEIYPKVFRGSNCQNKQLMLQHLFYWLGYCRKWSFPFLNADLSAQTVEHLPDMIIYLMTNQIYKTISNQSYHQYMPVEESLYHPRGKINFSRYVKNGLGRGSGHILECDYEPFSFDNSLNRLIKFCLRKLSAQTTLRENLQLINDCLNILDDVEDVPCSLRAAQTIYVNPFLTGYEDVLTLCKYILQNQMYDNESYEANQWCLLLPMEEIFEDFVAGFLEHHFEPEWMVEYQKSDAYVSDDPRVFNMQHDIFLTKGVRKIIVDTKYKIRDTYFKNDLKKGVNQSDLYQVLSYAFKRGCTEVFLIYPNANENLNDPDIFRIKTGFNSEYEIKVTAMEIPFWSLISLGELESNLFEFLKTHLLA